MKFSLSDLAELILTSFFLVSSLLVLLLRI